MKLSQLVLTAFIAIACGAASAKLPPPAPVDPKVAEEKAAKDKAAAELTKAQQAMAEDRAVKNFQGNMKKSGKPIPKPTVIAQAPAAPGKAATQAAKPADKAQATKK
jgi:hypothetical protein